MPSHLYLIGVLNCLTAVGGTYVVQPLFSFFGQICEEH
jgi:hypothetical protein